VKARIGVVGCGVISQPYLSRLTTFDTLEVVACADVLLDRAKERAEAFGVPTACSPEELLAHPEIDLVVNLTVPAAHAPLADAALDAGKSVYGEKPIALDRDEAVALLAKADGLGLHVGSAPDTFLGAGLQTCRALIDEGAIGEVVAVNAMRMVPGPELWHPDPAFLYRRGAGPLFDLGIYDITAAVAMLGPVARVTGATRSVRDQRTVGRGPLAGTAFDVEVPTHTSAVLQLASGPLVTLVASFDVVSTRMNAYEVYGTEGTLAVPDPNTFGGPVRLHRLGGPDWEDVPLRHRFAEQARGVGVADMVLATRNQRPARASGRLALHVLDVMQSVIESAESGAAVDVTTTCERPAPLPVDWDGNAD
jgi:predicted dehydrogenase